MPSKHLSRGGLRISYPETHVASRHRPDSRDRGIEGQSVHDALLTALGDNDFEQVDEVQLTPVRARDLGGGGSGVANIELDLDEGESAVVLVDEGGCYSWHLPQEAPSVTGVRTREIGPRQVTFSIPVGGGGDEGTRQRPEGEAGRTRSADDASPTHPGPTRGLLGGIVSGVLRMTILKFAAPALAGKAIGFLERHVEPGLVVMRSPDPASWTRVEKLTDVGLPTDRPVRVLLFVHGTFSSTAHAFGILGCTQDGRAWLNRAFAAYDAVVGFDHPTLSVDPLANATDLLRRVSGHAGSVTFDVVCHSRGGLTARSFAEQVLPPSGWSGHVDKAVFVAATNGGTRLADPKRWRDLIDITTNLATVGASVAAGLPGGAPVASLVAGVVRGLGALVKYLAGYVLEDGGVPGLAAMMPDGPFVTGLNETQPGQPGPGTAWYVAQSDFHVTLFDDSHRPPEFPRELAVRLAEGAVDQLFKGPNDLVVDVHSMSEIDPATGGFVAGTLDFGTNDLVYHGNYFGQAKFTEAAARWLLGTLGRGLAMAEPPGEVHYRMAEPADTYDAPRLRPPSLDAAPEPYAAAAPPPPPPLPTPAPVMAMRGGLTPRGLEREVGAVDVADSEARPADDPATGRLLAEMSAEPLVGQPTSLRVALSRDDVNALFEESTAVGSAVLVRPERILSVHVVAKRNCTVQGRANDTFGLPSGGGTSELRFEIVPQQPGPLTVTVIVRDGEVPLAMLTLEATAVDERNDSAATVRSDSVAETPENVDIGDAVWLEILQTEQARNTIFQYTVRAPKLGLLQRFESPPLRDIEGYVAELFKDLRQMFADHGSGAAFQSALQDRGTQLFDELFPEPLQELLWKIRRSLTHLVLLADEPYLPWELVHLKPPEGPRQKTPAFLGQLGLVRWQFTGFPRSTLRARSGRVRTVCPEYLDPSWALAGAAQEADFLTQRLGAIAVPATERDVRKLLRTGGFDLLHFSGHGMADPTDIAAARLMLNGRRRRGGQITPQYLTATAVAQNAQLRERDGSGPLVVLNACQTGRGGEQLSSLGGFARAFLQAGAAAYVSTLWSVGDEPARDFVEAFYDRLIAGDSVGKAATAARQAAREAGDATWLAYVVYARPDARLVLN